MIESVLIAIGIWAGADYRRAIILGTSVAFPLPFLLLVAFRWWNARSGISTTSVEFCHSVASELRAGSTLRSAVGEAARSVDAGELCDAAISGAPFSELARQAQTTFTDIGPELGACIDRAGPLGAPTADLFDEIGSVALARVDASREVQSALAPARATLIVLFGVPLIALWLFVSRGDLSDYLATPAQRLVILLGLGMTGLAVLVGWGIWRRAL